MESRKLIDTEHPSMTAFNILMATWRASKKYPHLLTSYENQLLDAFIPVVKSGFPLDGPNGYRLFGMYYAPRQLTATFLSNYAIPYYDDGVIIRKLMIKQWLQDKINEGVTQVIIVGDGFDIRSLVVGLENPTIKIFALDRGPTRLLKLKAIQKSSSCFSEADIKGDTPQKFKINNITYLEFDANQQTLIDCLMQNEFDNSMKTAVLLEGFGMYVKREVIQSLLRSLEELVPQPGDLKVLLSMMDKIKHTPLGENSLKNSDELYKSSLKPSEAIEFFQPFGEVTGKFSACFHLAKLGNFDGQNFIDEDHKQPESKSLPHEYYYELTSANSQNLLSTIDNVPELPLPPIYAPVPTSWCSVL